MPDDDNIVTFPRHAGQALTDEYLAEVFVAQHGEVFCYSLERKRWRMYQNGVWRDNAQLHLESAIGAFLDEAVMPHVRKFKERMRVGSVSCLLALERRLRSVYQIDDALLDADPWLLNCPGGTGSLKFEGAPFALRAHRAEDHLTKITAANPVGDCPMWLEFVDWVARGDADLASYLQKLAGYALVGEASEQMLAFCYGTGGNGKSVFLSTLLHVLGNYGVSCPSEVFTVQRFERHPEELMRLKGARLIVSSEVAPNCQWNDARIKAVSGGEHCIARGMRESSQEFDFTGTLIMAGNNQPELHGVDNAIRRRFHMVPFLAYVPDDEVDRHIGERLRCEAGGILKWVIEGCRLWQLEGLTRPQAVASATIEYIAEQDHVQQWLDEECDANLLATVRTPTKTLYGSWRKWAEAAGLDPGYKNTLSAKLKAMQFEHVRSNGFTGFKGIALK